MNAAAAEQERGVYEDLHLASQNYWAGRTGRENPPAPTYRMVNGKMTLGRYMDAYGCESYMRAAQIGWQGTMTTFFFSGVGVILGITIGLVFLLFLPVALLIYATAKAKWRYRYEYYQTIQTKIVETGEPQWVPYSKSRLKAMHECPPEVSP